MKKQDKNKLLKTVGILIIISIVVFLAFPPLGRLLGIFDGLLSIIGITILLLPSLKPEPNDNTQAEQSDGGSGVDSGSQDQRSD